MLAKALQAHHRVIGVHHVLLESRHRAVIAVRTEQQIPVQAMPSANSSLSNFRSGGTSRRLPATEIMRALPVCHQ